MAISITHAKISGKPDGVDTSLVQPSDWNANHALTCATARILGRWDSGTGAVQEITIGTGLTLTGSGVLNNTLDLSTYAPLASPSFTGGISVANAGSQPLLLNRTGGSSVLHAVFQNDGVTRGWLGANATYPFFASLAGGGTCIYADTAGNFTAVGNVTAYSDARLKKNVSTIHGALHKVGKLRGVQYQRIETDAWRVGLIAQELREVVPEAVLENDEGMLSVSYGDLVGVLVEAIKELKARVEMLETR